MVEIRPTDGAAQFAMRLREIERRLAGLETMRRTPYTDIYDADGNLLGKLSAEGLAFFNVDSQPTSKLDGEGITVYDEDGVAVTTLDQGGLRVMDGTGQSRLVAGVRSDDYGVDVWDAEGNRQFIVRGDGMHRPYLTVPVIELGANRIAVTSGSYDTTHSAQIEYTSHTGLYCWVNAVCDSGTTGEFRLRTWFNGASRNTTAAVNAGSSVVQQQFRWLHQIPLATGPVTVYVEARRTSGTGNVYIYQSHGVTLAAPDLCVANGVP